MSDPMTPARVAAIYTHTAHVIRSREEYARNPSTTEGVRGPCLICETSTNTLSGFCRRCQTGRRAAW